MKLIFLISILGLFLTHTVFGEEVVRVRAKVNNQVITSGDLDEYCKILSLRTSNEERGALYEDEEFRKEALRRLVEDKLILDEAKSEKIGVPLSWVDDRLKRMIYSYSTRDEFDKSLVGKGLNITQLRERIKEQYLMRAIIEKYVKSFVRVSPVEISTYYAGNQDKFYSSPKYIFHIAKSKDKNVLSKIAKALKNKGILQAEQEFEDTLIKIESKKNELKKDISGVLGRLKEGEFGIEKIDKEFYLIYLDAFEPPRLLSLDETKEQIHLELEQEKFKERFSRWLDELKEKGVVKYYE